jgi:acyl dehydratase
MPDAAWTYESLKDGTAKVSGTSGWLLVDQERINLFGDVTSDPDPMHVDPAWCKRSSPFGQPIAFGFLTMSLLTCLLRDAFGAPTDAASPDTYPLNYGFDRLRLISPVPVNSRVRGQFRLLNVHERKPGQLVVKVHVEVRVEHERKPALVAEWLTVFMREEDSASAWEGRTQARAAL